MFLFVRSVADSSQNRFVTGFEQSLAKIVHNIKPVLSRGTSETGSSRATSSRVESKVESSRGQVESTPSMIYDLSMMVERWSKTRRGINCSRTSEGIAGESSEVVDRGFLWISARDVSLYSTTSSLSLSTSHFPLRRHRTFKR